MKEANNVQKAEVQPKGVRFCLFSQPGVAYKKACSSIEVLIGFTNSRSSHQGCFIKICVLKKFEKFTQPLFNKVTEHLRTTASVIPSFQYTL